jgi:hypothetical protein
MIASGYVTKIHACQEKCICGKCTKVTERRSSVEGEATGRQRGIRMVAREGVEQSILSKNL